MFTEIDDIVNCLTYVCMYVSVLYVRTYDET